MASRTVPPGTDAWSTLDPVEDVEGPAPLDDAERYTPVGELGEGATSEVLLAYDARLRREVALKLLKRDSPGARARFVAEGQVAAQLEHPNILPIHDAGTDRAGRVYLAMKRIRGESLAELLLRDPPPLARRLDIFRKVCDAISFAHAHGVLHRDLKPENVMVGPFGEVLVADWGLARPLAGAQDGPVDVERFHDDAQRTREGQIAGTPAYMAPEQAEGRLADLDARSDVYGLGATLWHLLVGHAPFTGPVNQVLADVRAGRVPSARREVPSVPRELDLVARRAMARDPARRYPSAHALREDIDAWLDGRPLVGVPSSWAQRLTKWAARHRRPLSAAAAVAAVALLGFAGATWRYVVDVGRARDAALHDSERASAAEQATARELVRARIALSDALASQGHAGEAREVLATLELPPDSAALARALSLARAQRALESPPPVLLCSPHDGAAVRGLALAPDGERGASWGNDKTIRVWTLPGCVVESTLQLAGGAPGPTTLTLDETGVHGLFVVGEQVLRVERGAVVGSPLVAPAAALRVGEDDRGPWVANAQGVWRPGPDAAVRDPWETPDRAFWSPAAGGALRLATSNRTGGELGGAWTRTGRALWLGPGINEAVPTADGRLLLTGSAVASQVIDLGTGKPRWSAAAAAIERVGVAPGDRFIWEVGFGGLIRVRDIEDGAAVATFGDGLGRVLSAAATLDARLVAAATEDGRVRAWLRPTTPRHRPGAPMRAIHGLSVHPTGELYATGDDAGNLELHDTATGALLRRWTGFPDAVRQVAFSPDGSRLAAALRLYGVGVFDLTSPAPRFTTALPARTISVGWVGGEVVTVDVDGTWWRVGEDGAHRGDAAQKGASWQVTPMDGGRYLIAGHVGGDRVARVVDADGHTLRSLPNAADAYQSAAHADLVALGRGDGKTLVWDTRTDVGRELHTDDGPTLGVAFSPDGTLLATTGYAQAVRLWDVASGTQVRSYAEHRSPGVGVRFLPDGRHLLSASLDGVTLLPLDADQAHATALAAMNAGGPAAAEGAAALGWWERVGADAAPLLRARARLAAGDLDGAARIAAEAPERGALLTVLAGLAQR